MNELANTQPKTLSPLDTLAEEAQFYSQRFIQDTLQLGRVFTEAKSLVKHGEWGAWVEQNAGCNERTAQQLMQAYTRFGGNAIFSKIEKSKMFKLLALPVGTEEKFISENDIQSMTAREVEAAVKRVKKEEQMAREEAVREAEERVRGQLRNEIKRLQGSATSATNARLDAEKQRDKLARANDQLQQEIKEQETMIGDLQSGYDALQEQLLNNESAVAKGDAERIPASTLTPEMFASAVRQFIGIVARMPHMSASFGKMDHDTRESYSELLSTVETWCAGARAALDRFEIEGVVVDA